MGCVIEPRPAVRLLRIKIYFLFAVSTPIKIAGHLPTRPLSVVVISEGWKREWAEVKLEKSQHEVGRGHKMDRREGWGGREGGR